MIPLLLALGCAGGDDADQRFPDRPILPRYSPAPTVLVVVVDTLTKRHLGRFHGEWATSPNLDAFFDQAVLLSDTQVVRSLTGVSVSTITTGTWPRTHRVRDNKDWKLPWNPLLPERFQEAGYTTLGYAANTCQFIDRGIDERTCTWNFEVDKGFEGQLDRDRALVDQLVADLAARPADEPLFLWLHLIDPHDPFTAVQPWYDEFHPEPYEGALDPEDTLMLEARILSGEPLTAEEQRHLEAVYASQVRQVDEELGRVLTALEDAGRMREAVVLFTADHGEELGEHNTYFFHGCSPYQPAMQVVSALYAPGRLPQGVEISTTARSVDLAPTLADLAGIGWRGFRDGDSLVDELLSGALEERPAFFERGTGTAGVVSGGHRYILDVNEGFAECKPYDLAGTSFPGEREELYRHADDPLEKENIAAADPATLAELRARTCEWILAAPWQSASADRTHPLVAACR